MDETELALLPVLVRMQRHGIRMDSGVLHEMSADMFQQLGGIETGIYDSVGHQVNLNSPAQLSDLLFKELGLPHTKRTKTGHYSTDANSLESLKGIHPVVDQILEYRQVAKLKSTYVDALPDMVNPQTGRVHTSYNQTGSATGRISSSDPNLQNIPIRTQTGRQVRRAFVADGAPDWQLFSADYSQIELRVLAHMSQDSELLDAFRRGEDIHTATASLMFGGAAERGGLGHAAHCQGAELRGDLWPFTARHNAADGLQPRSGEGISSTPISPSTLGISEYLERVKAQARADQYVETLMGRRRYLPEINSSNFNTRGAAERMAINNAHPRHCSRHNEAGHGQGPASPRRRGNADQNAPPGPRRAGLRDP